MALIKCEQCGNMVSENAPSCPKCGNPMNGAQTPQNSFAGSDNTSPKNKTTAGILAILLGCFGGHYFYVGKFIPAIVFLIVTLFGWFYRSSYYHVRTFWFLPVIIFIISVIQGIMILSMSDQDFNKKYVNTTNQFPLF